MLLLMMMHHLTLDGRVRDDKTRGYAGDATRDCAPVCYLHKCSVYEYIHVYI